MWDYKSNPRTSRCLPGVVEKVANNLFLPSVLLNIGFELGVAKQNRIPGAWGTQHRATGRDPAMHRYWEDCWKTLSMDQHPGSQPWEEATNTSRVQCRVNKSRHCWQETGVQVQDDCWFCLVSLVGGWWWKWHYYCGKGWLTLSERLFFPVSMVKAYTCSLSSPRCKESETVTQLSAFCKIEASAGWLTFPRWCSCCMGGGAGVVQCRCVK